MWQVQYYSWCVELSYLHVAEDSTENFNIGLSRLSLEMDPNTKDWLMDEVLAGTLSMKVAHRSITEYNEVFMLLLRHAYIVWKI